MSFVVICTSIDSSIDSSIASSTKNSRQANGGRMVHIIQRGTINLFHPSTSIHFPGRTRVSLSCHLDRAFVRSRWNDLYNGANLSGGATPIMRGMGLPRQQCLIWCGTSLSSWQCHESNWPLLCTAGSRGSLALDISWPWPSIYKQTLNLRIWR